jgi:hypothetical protein
MSVPYWQLRSLMEAVYRQDDPSKNVGLLDQLVGAAPTPLPAPPPTPAPAAEQYLGADTTKLSVETTLCMKALPTGIYHLFNPGRDPLLRVRIENHDSVNTKRVRVEVYLEELSAHAVATREIEPSSNVELPFLPTLIPARAREVTEIQWATLHVVVTDLDGKEEGHETHPILCLARSSGYNLARDGATGALQDLSHYYGAWVTPHVEAVEERVRVAAGRLPAGGILGYQQDADGPIDVTPQVEALFDALAQAEVRYVNSIIAYGAPPGVFMQRTRLPRESLAAKSANCLDGTVLMASLLEAASLSPALVLVPGHAFVGWETWGGKGDWQFLETTLIGTKDFAAARASGQRQYEKWKERALVHPVAELREKQIWPME